MSIETLTNVGPVHWGVMLAQGWKGELAATGRPESWVVARDWASQVELLGFHGVWVFDHFQPYPARDGSPVLEAWTTLAALSQVTDRVVIGTLVSCAGYRNPAVTVKMAENLHLLSAGRFCLGLGAGWDQPEFELLGIPFGSAAERSDRLLRVATPCRGLDASPGRAQQPACLQGATPQSLPVVGGGARRS